LSLKRNFLSLALLAAAGSNLAACCAPVARPGSVQAGSGRCGAHFVPSKAPPTGGAQNR
jgi:hypothetical protein